MANPDFPQGISLNLGQKGLLNINEDLLASLINTRPISDIYVVESTPFARGKFASVKKCRHRETGVEYAAKAMRKRRRLEDHRADMVHEVAVLSMAAPCDRIVNLREVFETPTEMVLVLELAAGGELQRVVDIQEGMTEAEAVHALRQTLEGLQYLHERNIAHLDIKPQNILLDGPNGDIKLCDFGISRVIQNGVDVREILGTPDYVAPEILSYEPICLATDMWSIGVLAYVLLTGYSPFAGDTKQETFCNISQCNITFPEDMCEVSAHAQDFILRTLVLEPKGRLTVTECLQHPWLSPLPPSPSLPTHSLIVGCKRMASCCHDGRCCHDEDQSDRAVGDDDPHLSVLLQDHRGLALC